MRRGGKSKKPKSKSKNAGSALTAPARGLKGEPVSLKLAKSLWGKGQFDAALKQFGKAVRENRHHVPTLVDAARAFGARYAHDKSDSLLQRALTVAGRHPDVQFMAGESYRMLGRFDAAEKCFRRAVQLTETAPRAELELANLCERGHRVEEGLTLVSRVLKTWPTSASAAILKARLLRRQEHSDEAELVLRDLLNSTNAKAALQAEAWGELALLLDKQAQFDEAWQSIRKCKEIQLERDQAERQAAAHVGKRFAELAAQLQSDDFQRWASQDGIPPAACTLLTGFPRSGTTLLEQILDAHPQVISLEEQDILSADIFPALGSGDHNSPIAKLLNGLTTEQIQQARQRYFNCAEAVMREDVGKRTLIDKNPAMIPMIPVVLRLFPEMKLLLSLRDPRDVVLSCYLRYLPLNPVSVCFLTLERTTDRYAADLHSWLKYRERLTTPWTEIRYEDLVEDLEAAARRVIAFLGLDWEDQVLQYRDQAAAKMVRSPTYGDVARPIYQSAVGRWRNYEGHMEPALRRLEPIAKELGYGSA